MYYIFDLLVDAFSHLAANVERMKTLIKRSAGESMLVYNFMNSTFIEADFSRRYVSQCQEQMQVLCNHLFIE